MTTIRTLTSIVAVAALAAVGCSTNDVQDAGALDPVPTITPDPPPTPTPDPDDAAQSTDEASESSSPEPLSMEPELTERGTIAKEIGEDAGIADEAGNMKITFRVTDIEIVPEGWSDSAKPPEQGRFVVLSIEGETTEHVDPEWDYFGWFESDFQILTSDGVRVNSIDTAAAWSAIPDSERLPSDIGPSQRFAGKIALDSPTDHGTVIYGGGG